MARNYCTGCSKPISVCLCDYLFQQDNNLPVLILQHSDEQKKPLSTVPLIEKGLTLVEVLYGQAFTQERVQDALRNIGGHNPLLLYPLSNAISTEKFVLDLSISSTNPACFQKYDSLIVLDGTWRNTRELVLQNSWLSSLPSLRLKNVGSSRYRIRKSTHEESLSTIEAVSKIMTVCDPQFNAEAFLRPFNKMIDKQIEHMGEEVFLRNYC